MFRRPVGTFSSSQIGWPEARLKLFWRARRHQAEVWFHLGVVRTASAKDSLQAFSLGVFVNPKATHRMLERSPSNWCVMMGWSSTELLTKR